MKSLFLLLFIFMPVANDISMAGIKINDSKNALSALKLKKVAYDADIDAHKYTTANGNDLSITIVDGKVAYMENDWLHKAEGSKPLITNFEFGKTSLRDIRNRFGNNGFSYKRTAFHKTATDLLLFNCFEVDSRNQEILVVVTKISLKAKVTEDNIADLAKLESIILSTTDYLDQIWGEDKVADPGSRKIKL